ADTTFNSIGTLTAGTLIDADGLSDDGVWVRIIFNDRPGWVQRSTVTDDEAINSLPTLGNEVYTPMQAFYLRTGIGQVTCSDIPDDSLLIQGPEDITVQITVNGANIELGSSGMLRIIEDADGNPALDIAVLDGEFVVKADEHNPVDVVIPAGHHSQLCMSESQNSGLDGEANDMEVSCGASEPEFIPPEMFSEAWCGMEQMPANLLNYALTSCYDTHTVQSGENLFRIAQNYCTTTTVLASLNGIGNIDNIVVGTVLTLPLSACEGTGATTPPPGTIPPASDPPATTDDDTTDTTDDVISNGCESFTVSPQTVTDNTFSLDWMDVVGASSYVVAVFDASNTEVQAIPTAESALTTNGGNFPSVGYIDIRAYDDAGGYLCYARFNYTRVGVPSGEATERVFPFSVQASCEYAGPDFKLDVVWIGATEAPVTISYVISPGVPVSTTSDDLEGSFSVLDPNTFSSVTVTSGNESETITFISC
ncbi:MAG: LysM domain-containing protein, partial [Chloroflexota bacterium]